MYQIDVPSAVTMPPASTPQDTPGYFTDGNPAMGQAATIVPAEFLNVLMRELLNLLRAADITPDKAKFDQVARAVQKLAQTLGDTRYIPVSEKGQADGIATLDGQGRVPTAQLPPFVGREGDQTIDGALMVRYTLYLHDPGNGSTRTLANTAGELRLGGQAGAPHAAALHDDGVIWSAAYGLLHEYFARRSELDTKQPAGDYATRAELNRKLDTEGDQTIHGELQVRYWLRIQNPNDATLRAVHHNDGTIGFFGPSGWTLRVGDNGDIFTPMFGWFSHYFATLATKTALDRYATKEALNTKQPAGHYVQSATGNAIKLGWKNTLEVCVDHTYLGALWHSGNFDPNAKADTAYVNNRLEGKANTADMNDRLNAKADTAWVKSITDAKADQSALDTKADKSDLETKADKSALDGKANAGAECQYHSEIWDFGVMRGNSTHKVQDLPAPWVVTGLAAVWLTDDRLHGIGMRARKIRNQ